MAYSKRDNKCPQSRTRALQRTVLGEAACLAISHLQRPDRSLSLVVRQQTMAYPAQIERLHSVLKSLPGVEEVEADHTPLEDLDLKLLSLVDFGDLPHATIHRTKGGLPAEALGQIFIRVTPTLESWRTLEFLSWQVRDWSRAGRCVQIRTRALPPVAGERIQLGSTLGVIIDFFVAGLDAEPEGLLRQIQEFAEALESSLHLYGLEWRGGEVHKKAESGPRD
jgi:hypothetical protein